MQDINEMTIGQAKELASMFGGKNETTTAFEIGEVYLIRTVTMIDTGIVQSVNEHEVVLIEAAWIADTGRFSEALKTCDFSEVEPFPSGEVIIGRGAIIDAVKIKSTQRTVK